MLCTSLHSLFLPYAKQFVSHVPQKIIIINMAQQVDLERASGTFDLH